MKTTITVNIEDKLREAMAFGFEDGFEAGIKLAIQTLRQITTEHSHKTHIEATESQNIDQVISELENSVITRSPHKKHRWKPFLKDFINLLLDGSKTKDEIIALGAKAGLTKNAVVKQAWNLGFTCKKAEQYFIRTSAPKKYKLQETLNEILAERNQ